MLAWLRILWRVVLGWMLVLFVWALSIICLVRLVSTMSGWFWGRWGMMRMAVVMVKSCGYREKAVMLERSCHVSSA